MPDSRPALTNRLGFRLAFALALALLPLGILTGYQVQSLVNEAQARSEAAVLGETLLAVSPVAALVLGGRSAVAAMAVPMATFHDDQAICTDLMRKLLDQGGASYSFAAFVPVDGQVNCASNGGTLDLADSARLADMIADPQPSIQVIRDASVSGTTVLAFGHPVFDSGGVFLGYISLSMPHTILQSVTRMDRAAEPMGDEAPVSLITFNQDGAILTSTAGLDAGPNDLPVGRQLEALALEEATTFSALSFNGERRVYAVTPIIPGSLYALGSWPAGEITGVRALFISPYLPPVLMWLVSLLVAILAAERLVTRHIRVLRHSIRSFARGARLVGNVDLPGASGEIRDVADAYLKMTDTILHDEAELEDMVHQREVLLREVHHRVKNNLQLIASIMNLQMRQARNPETRVLMKSLQDRVMSLATVHRELYQTSGLTDVRADELLAQIVRQVLSMATGPGKRFDVVTTFDELRLTPDQAVPLSLLLTEALTNAVKYAQDKNGMPPRLEISLRRQSGNRAQLDIINTVGPEPAAKSAANTESSGLGSQLLNAFAQQLGGSHEIEVTDEKYRLWVSFEVLALTEAEVGVAAASAEGETGTSNE